jgi:hypothetical protein
MSPLSGRRWWRQKGSLSSKKYPTSEQYEGLQCSQGPVTCTYPQPEESNPPHPHILLYKIHLMLVFHLHLDLQSGSPFQNVVKFSIFMFPTLVSCSDLFFLLDLIMLIISGKELS